MTTLKSSELNILATLTEKTVYLSKLDGKIYKQFPLEHFKSEKFTEEVEFPGDFDNERIAFLFRIAEKRAEKESRIEAAKQAAYESRKEEISKIWNWRKGRTEAYLVNTYVESARENYNGNPVWFESVFVFGEQEAVELFNEFKGSEAPEMEQGRQGSFWGNNCYFVTELMHYNFDESERLEITTFNEIEKEILRRGEILERDSFAPSIEECDVIITYGSNSYGRLTKSKITYVEQRYSQTTTADLGNDQAAIKIADLDTFDDYDLAERIYDEGYMSDEDIKRFGFED